MNSGDARRRARPWLAAPLIVGLAFLSYLPALKSGFIWDDDAYVTDNALLHDLNGLKRVWFEIGATPQYYPLTFTTFWIEYHVWGLRPFGYHVTNIALHASSALLLGAVLRRLGVRGAGLAAVVFAVHPVMVESVAWVTERKNTLSLALALAALWCFLRSRWIEPEEKTDRAWVAGGALLYGAALFGKTVVAPLPIIVVLLAWWKYGRVTGRVVVGATLLTVIGVGAGALTAYVEHAGVGASGGEFNYAPTLFGELAFRTLVAGRATLFYVWKLLVPYPLMFNYPRWTIDVSSPAQCAAPLVILVVMFVLFFGRTRWGRGPIVACLIYVGCLFPALGFVNVFPHVYSWVADHFQYHAATVFCAAVGMALNRLPHAIRSSLPATIIIGLMGLTYVQAGHYHDVETLWRHTLTHNPKSWLADTTLGTLEAARGSYDSAEVRFNRSIVTMKAQYRGQRDAGFGLPYYQLGVMAETRGDPALAERRYREAIELDPSHGPARHNLALLLLGGGRVDDAEAQWTLATSAPAMRRDADLPYRAGTALQQAGYPDRAMKWLKMSAERKKGN